MTRSRSRASQAAPPPPTSTAPTSRKRAAAQPPCKRKQRFSSPSSPRAGEPAPVAAVQEDCGICLSSEYEFSGKPSCCNHRFCFPCISRWGGEGSNTCPVCKRRFTKLDKLSKSGRVVLSKSLIKRNLGDDEDDSDDDDDEEDASAVAQFLLFGDGLHPTLIMLLFPALFAWDD